MHPLGALAVLICTVSPSQLGPGRLTRAVPPATTEREERGAGSPSERRGVRRPRGEAPAGGWSPDRPPPPPGPVREAREGRAAQVQPGEAADGERRRAEPRARVRGAAGVPHRGGASLPVRGAAGPPAALPAALWGLRELLGPDACAPVPALWPRGRARAVVGGRSQACRARRQGLSALQQESVIQTMELRNYYSLYCLHQETQLVHAYLPLTSHILGAFVNSQVQGHKEVGPPQLPVQAGGRPPLPEAAAQLTLTSDLGGAPGLDTALARLSGLLVARETREAVLVVAGMGRGAGHAGRRGRGPRPQEELQGRSEVECTEPRTRAERWGVAVRGGRGPASFLPEARGPRHKGTPQPEAAWPVLSEAASRLSQHCGAHSGRRPKSLPTRPGRPLPAPGSRRWCAHPVTGVGLPLPIARSSWWPWSSLGCPGHPQAQFGNCTCG